MQTHSEKLKSRFMKRSPSRLFMLLDVFPVGGIESPSEEGKYTQEQ